MGGDDPKGHTAERWRIYVRLRFVCAARAAEPILSRPTMIQASQVAYQIYGLLLLGEARRINRGSGELWPTLRLIYGQTVLESVCNVFESQETRSMCRTDTHDSVLRFLARAGRRRR